VRSGSYDNLVSGFGSWIQQQEPAKAPRIFEWATENKAAVAALFQAFIEVSSLKNQLVRQLDSQSQAVQASINDEPGHEGYVGQGMKFVDRMRFSAANFAKNNPELG
jgi:ribonuclease HI